MAVKSDARGRDSIVLLALQSRSQGKPLTISYRALLSVISELGQSITTPTLRASLKRLDAAGAISIQKHGEKTSHTYTVNEDEAKTYLKYKRSVDAAKHEKAVMTKRKILYANETINSDAIAQHPMFYDVVELLRKILKQQGKDVDIEDLIGVILSGIEGKLL